MELSALAVFCAALLLNAGSPGPSVAALVSRVLTRGWQDVAPFVAAMWLGEVLWLTLAIAGLAAAAELFHYGFLAIKYLGVAYLLYLAWRMWNAPTGSGDPAIAERASRADRAKMFLAGLSITLGNPKIMLFYLALLPTIIDIGSVSMTSWAILSAATVVILSAIDIGYIVLAARARRLLARPAAVRIANRASAVMLGCAAGVIAAKS